MNTKFIYNYNYIHAIKGAFNGKSFLQNTKRIKKSEIWDLRIANQAVQKGVPSEWGGI